MAEISESNQIIKIMVNYIIMGSIVVAIFGMGTAIIFGGVMGYLLR